MYQKFIQHFLEKYVKKFFENNKHIKLILVAGSVGKTSTKFYIRDIISSNFKTRMQEGNHNTTLSAPLAILGIKYPQNVRSIHEWIKVILEARRVSRQNSEIEIIIQELGIDNPSDMETFSKYLHADIAVLTAISAEHLEFFKDLDHVAKSELLITKFANQILINSDDIDEKYINSIENKNLIFYGTSAKSQYRIEMNLEVDKKINSGKIFIPELHGPVDVKSNLIGKHSYRSALAAVAVGHKLKVPIDQIVENFEKLMPIKGRMNLLEGINNSIIIDDSYNSSPVALKAALEVLKEFKAKRKIAILGSMNELGEYSKEEHINIGKTFDKSFPNILITVGEEANKYIATKALENGCTVKSFNNSIDAGQYVKNYLEKGTVVLVKGSQGGIYTEDAIRIILKNNEDEQMLVRQSEEWNKIKKEFYLKINKEA